jgi:hypothetical protein
MAAPLAQARLVIEQVHLRRRAGLKQVDDALGRRPMVRQPRQAARLRMAVFGEQPRQCDRTEAASLVAQESAARRKREHHRTPR